MLFKHLLTLIANKNFYYPVVNLLRACSFILINKLVMHLFTYVPLYGEEPKKKGRLTAEKWYNAQ